MTATAEQPALRVGGRVLIREGRWAGCAGRLDSITEENAVVDLGGQKVTVAPSMLKAMES